MGVAGGAAAKPPDTAARLQALGAETLDAHRRGAYAEGAAAAERALALSRKALGPRHPNTLRTMDTLAALRRMQGRLSEAEPLHREALRLGREVLGPRHPDTLSSMNGLALLHQAQGRFGEAEPLLREALRLRREALGPRHPDTLASMNNLALLHQAQGRHGEAEPLYQEALAGRREALGPRHPGTLAVVNNLALLHQAQGSHGEAEPLFREALEGLLAELGPRHPDTLGSMNNLAALYWQQGRLGEAEPLYQDVLRLRREALGPHHPATLQGMNNLAVLHQAQGRFGEAEALLREALRLRREALGPRHPDTLASMDDLGGLHREQNRSGEAEPLLREALRLKRAALGPLHPATLQSMNNLGGLHEDGGRLGEAEPLFREALEGLRTVLGPRHPDTLAGMDNLAGLCWRQGRLAEAERLYREALELRREVLGPRHPDTMDTMGDLAFLHRAQGRHGEAEPLFREALEGTQESLGPAHPTTLLLRLGGALNLAALGRPDAAAERLGAMEEPVLARLGAEPPVGGAAAGGRGRLAASQASYQHAALSLALLPGAGPAAAELAASAVLRLKGLRAEEEAQLARIVRRGPDPRAREIAAELAGLHGRVAALSRAAPQRGDAAHRRQVEAAALNARLREQELALSRVSRDYDRHLGVRRFDPAGLRAALAGLPQPAALLDLHEFRPVDLRTGALGSPRRAGLLVRADTVRVVDLGPVEGTAAAARALLADVEGEAGRQAAHDLHNLLLDPFAADLAGLERLYIAPDDALRPVPFAALRGPDGRRLVERLDLRLLQTGRDLRRPDPARPARGLLALGGIDFDASATPDPVPGGVGAAEAGSRTTAAAAARGFAPLPASAAEARAVAGLYRRARPDEPVEVWEGADASEARLRAGERPPRALHLATYGFHRPADATPDRPMPPGVALAGANLALRDAGRDGVLHAAEARDLDLEGTELVTLSACDVTQGRIDHGEGVSGLVRALRTAGARHALVALRPVSDAGAAEFVGRFYRHWLGQGRSDPAAAFRAAQLDAIAAAPADPSRRDQTWARFVLVGG